MTRSQGQININQPVNIKTEYIYLLIPKEYMNSNDSVRKIGKTKRENFERFKEYTKGSLLVMQSMCSNCDICEKELLKIFSKKYFKRKDIGNEYFEGDSDDMMDEINKIIKKYKNYSDRREFFIKEIIGHRGDFNDIMLQEFLVVWRGYGTKYNTWEPWSGLMDTQALQSYTSNRRK